MNHDDLILRSLQGRISSEERARLWNWLDADPRNERRYEDVAVVWRATREYDDAPFTSPPPVEAITSEAVQRRRGSPKWMRRFRSVAAVAASFVVGLGVARSWDPGGAVVDDAAPEVVTGIGEVATTRLPDGTIVRLGPESRLVFSTAPNAREVTLDGQAFFAVARNPEKPFLVRTAAGQARVLGTRFELAARAGQFRLLVVEGQVAVSSGETEVAVGARQMTHLREGEEPSTVEVEDVWPLLRWVGNFLAFESTSLREVGAELERRFDMVLVFDDPTLADETVTVWFQAEPIEEVVSVLCRLVEARCAMAEASVRMSRSPGAIPGAAVQRDEPRQAQ